MRALLSCIVLIGAAGCLSANATYEGTIGGERFDIADAAYITKHYPARPTGAEVTLSLVVLSSSYNICEDVQAQVIHPNQKFILLFAGASSADPEQSLGPTQLGVYGRSGFGASDASCQPGDYTTASSGTITFQEVGFSRGNDAKGTFELTFPSGEHGTGTFTATPCNAIESYLDKVAAIIQGEPPPSEPFYLIWGRCR
jgi:hypothetical protein